jgi:cation/acetate symporter
LTLIILSPPVWPGPDSHGSPLSLTNPTIIAVPLGFLACRLGTLAGRRDAADGHGFAEMLFRTETGYGARATS